MMTFTIIGICLAVLAIALAWPFPSAMARATLAHRPAVLMALWQLLGLSGGISLIAAVSMLALAPSLHTLRQATSDGLTDSHIIASLSWWQWLLLLLALGILTRLLYCLATQYVNGRRARRKHADLVGLLTSPSTRDPGTRVLRSDVPMAYCVPGEGTTVLSTGLIERLDDAQRHAVVAHEMSHLRYHHDLFVMPFAAWHRALPLLPATATALSAVSTLIELMADDRARALVGDEVLAEAIDLTAGVHPGETSDALTLIRVRRLRASTAGV
ncbi:M56 family metallopeptidase [Brevibacterium sp. 50QC2O2]|jgi:Zn-dependent protease with chaperone function|uniref:M56 family metallopeptidase n=1 Tax=Brevibacterium TaxID=1696 RepID=UPI00211C9A51|nr:MULTISPECIES: M56 family metallopeptidase [unclassified Brevibacterium]MCQ9367000.1 M56 family metallopeptidase [Brevibacterium sp. 91QC2O2]MCQ9384149.1 M56 family metallopeptidase [Brevibacterium sp. 68QC2CO]MCQ9388373.1 M56 family metallopeptidase [Brevibacterium sp. 50QC2O2]